MLVSRLLGSRVHFFFFSSGLICFPGCSFLGFFTFFLPFSPMLSLLPKITLTSGHGSNTQQKAGMISCFENHTELR